MTALVGVRDWAAELVRRRDLLITLTGREIKVKYKQSVMGFLWAIFMPIVIVCAGLTVRYAATRLSGGTLKLEDFVLVSVKAVPWAFFVSTIKFASNSLIANQNLVTKIYMPREIFPLAAVLSQLVDFAIAAAVLAVVMAVAGVPLRAAMLWLPVLMALLVLLATALGVFLSAAALFFRDVKYIVEVILTFAIFFTPVFYEVALFDRWASLLLLNPAAPLLEGIGAAVAGRPLPAAPWLAYSAAVSALGCVAALVLFKRLEPYFAESV
jgi:ABC-type polysaccharide/polyol phosphate export permease